MPDFPLSDVRVLDLSRVLAGPFAGRMLSDLGADVVKVEPPDGDMTRIWGAVRGGVPGYFHQQNAGKRSICIDLAVPAGVRLVKSLVAQADIVIENFRAGVMQRLGLGYDVLSAIKPDLIQLSISGFGQDGPESSRAAYAAAIHAETGFVRRQEREGRPPQDVKMSVADTNAGLHGLIGVLAALRLRDQTGVGQHIDIAMIDTMLVTDDQLLYDLESSHHLGPKVSEVYQTGATPILIAGDFRHVWRRMTAAMGVVDPTPPDATLEEKIAARRGAANAFFLSLTSDAAVGEAMAKMNLAWGPVRRPADVRDSPTVQHRGSIFETDDRAGGSRPLTQSPYRFSNARAEVRGVAPHRGEHNRAVLEDWLAMADREIGEFVESGALLRDEDLVDE